MEMHNDIFQDLIDYISGEADSLQKEKVNAWLNEDQANQKEYRRLVRTYYKLKFSKVWDKLDTSTAKSKMLGQVRANKQRRILRYSAVAASIAILVSFSFIFQIFQLGEDMEQTQLSDISSPGEFKARLTLSTGKTLDLSRQQEQAIADAGTLITHRFEDGIDYTQNAADGLDSLPMVYNTLEVARGEEYKLVLADGTEVWLNSESELKYPVAFKDSLREVYVKGEAFFKVAHNASKPFIVNSGEVRTRVLGTEFNVMSYGSDERIEITLVRGKVNVEAGESDLTILPGKQVVVSKETLKLKERTVDTDLYSSWKDGIIYFDEMQLDVLTEKLSRWYDVDFVFETENLKTFAFTGAVKKEKPIAFTLDFLRTTSNLKFRVEKDKILVFEVK